MSSLLRLPSALQGLEPSEMTGHEFTQLRLHGAQPCEGEPEPCDSIAADDDGEDGDPGIGDATPCQCARCKTWWPAGGFWVMYANKLRCCHSCFMQADTAELEELLARWKESALLPLDRFTLPTPDAQEGGEAV